MDNTSLIASSTNYFKVTTRCVSNLAQKIKYINEKTISRTAHKMSSIQVQVFGEHLPLHGTVAGIRRAQSLRTHVLFLKRKQFLLNSLNSLDSNLLATSVGTSGELTFRFVLSVCRPCEYNASGRLTSLLDIMLSVYLSAFVMRYMINGGYTRSETICSILK